MPQNDTFITRTAVYRGTLQMYIKTLTTTYVPVVNGWNFGNAAWPMEAHGYIKDNRPWGIKGNVFNEDGATPFQAGNISAGTLNDNVFGPIFYNAGRLLGFCEGKTLSLDINAFEYAFKTGTPLSLQNFSYQNLTNLPNVSNTGMYAPFVKCLGIGRDNLLWSGYVDSLINKTIAFDGTRAFVQDPLFIVSNASVNYNPYLVLNWQGVNAMLAAINGATARRITMTDFSTFMQFIDVSWDNATIDTAMKSAIQSGVNRNGPSQFGWITTLNTTTATIDGKTLTGFLVLTAGDGSYYYVIEIIPTDTASKGWKGTASNGNTRFTADGTAIIRQSNSSTNLFISTGFLSQYRYLPVYPPMTLPPPPPDSEIPLTKYREVGAKS
jgi:hypothetical protein